MRQPVVDLEHVPTQSRLVKAWAFYLNLPLVVALPVIFLCWRHGFDGLYGQDAYAYYRYAVGALRANLLALEAPAPFFWPPGYPLLVALLSFVVGPQPLAAQIVSLVSGALVPVFTALLALELWLPVPDSAGSAIAHSRQRQARRIAFVAGLVTALTPQLWQSSAVSMSDTTALASATLGAWALARYGRGRHGAWLALAAAGLAFAMLTRMAYTTVAMIGAGYALFVLARRPWRKALAHAAVGVMVTVAILSPILMALGRGAAGDGGPAFLGHLGPTLWQLQHVFQNAFVTGNGRIQYRLANATYYALAPAHRFFFTPLMAPLLLPGMWRLWTRRTPAQLLLLALWPVSAYLLLVGYPVQNFRFTLIYLPPLAIVLAAGIVSIVRPLGRARPWVMVLCVTGLLWMIYGGWSLTESFMVRKQASLETVDWVENRLEPRAQLFTFGITLAFEQYTTLRVVDLYGLSAAELSALLQQQGPAYLLLDVANVEAQWSEHMPGMNYRYLQRDHGLQPLGQRQQYALFRIGEGGNDGAP